MVKNNIKHCLYLLNKVLFILNRLLIRMKNASSLTTCLPLNNWPCMVAPIPINLNPEEHNRGLHYHLFIVNLDRCNNTSCNHLHDLCKRICVYNKIEEVNLSVSNMIKRKDESKILAKHILCEHKYISIQKWNNGKCQCKCKNYRKPHVCEKNIFRILELLLVTIVNIQKIFTKILQKVKVLQNLF